MSNNLPTVKFKIENSLTKKHYAFLAKYSTKHSQNVIKGQVSKFAEYAELRGIGIASVNQDDILLYSEYLRGQKLSNSTYNSRLSGLKSYLEFIGIKGLSYPFQKVNAYAKVRIIAEKDFINIIRYLRLEKMKSGKKQTKFLRDYLMLSMLFFTGLRKSEVLNLKYADIQQEGDLYFYNTVGKGNKEIKKLFPNQLVSDLFQLRDLEKKKLSDFLFTSHYKVTATRLADNALNRILNQYNQLVNQRAHKVTVHGIRNLSASKLYSLDKDILKTQQHLNHANLNTTQIYLAKLQNTKIDYYDQMQEALA